MPPEQVCEYHEKRMVEGEETRMRVERISGKLTILLWILGFGIPMILGSHFYLYTSLNSMKNVTLTYIAKHDQKTTDDARRIANIETIITEHDRRLQELSNKRTGDAAWATSQ